VSRKEKGKDKGRKERRKYKKEGKEGKNAEKKRRKGRQGTRTGGSYSFCDSCHSSAIEDFNSCSRSHCQLVRICLLFPGKSGDGVSENHSSNCGCGCANIK